MPGPVAWDLPTVKICRFKKSKLRLQSKSGQDFLGEPQVIITYVLNHRDKFTPLMENTGDEVQDEWASKRSRTADFGFMKAIGRRHLYPNQAVGPSS